MFLFFDGNIHEVIDSFCYGFFMGKGLFEGVLISVEFHFRIWNALQNHSCIHFDEVVIEFHGMIHFFSCLYTIKVGCSRVVIVFAVSDHGEVQIGG